MSETGMVQDGLEHATEASEHGAVPHAKQAAVAIAVLCAGLAVCETGAKDTWAAFLTHPAAASDTWTPTLTARA